MGTLSGVNDSIVEVGGGSFGNKGDVCEDLATAAAHLVVKVGTGIGCGVVRGAKEGGEAGEGEQKACPTTSAVVPR